MNKLSKEELIERLKPVLKEQGFKKTKTTWRKSVDGLVLVLNVQGSQWSKEDYYINLGVYIQELGPRENPTENICHIQTRVEENQEFESLVDEVLGWFERYGDLAKLRTLKSQNSLPAMTMVVAHEYLDKE
jgi:hypothetical protein